MLEDLGLRRTTNATLVEVPPAAAEELEAGCDALRQTLGNWEPTAWLLPGDGNSRTLVRGGSSAAVTAEATDEPWKQKDPKLEAAALAKLLEPGPEAGESRSDYQIREGAGAILLAAAELQGAGYPTEAATIVSRLFETLGGPERAVAQAVNQLALAQYAEAAARFEAKHDWKKFDADIRRIAGRFGDSVPASAAILKVAALIRPRVEGKSPPAPRGEGIDAESRKLASELAEIRDPWGGAHYTWLLDPMLIPGQEAPDEGESSTVARITARRLRALPLLIALAEDDYPTTGVAQGGDRESLGLADVIGSDEMPLSSAIERMQIPVTRGTIARRLLQSAVPDSPDHANADLAERARAFLLIVGDGAPERIADAYLRSSDSGFVSLGVMWLLKHPGHVSPESIEQVLLKGLDSAEGFPDLQPIQTYLTLRAGEAGVFLAEVEKRIQQLAAADPDNKPQLDQILAGFREQSRPFDPEELIARVLAGGLSVTQAGAVIGRQPRSPALDGLTQGLLERAVASDNPGERYLLLALRGFLPAWRERVMAGLGEKATAQPLQPGHAPLWLKLLDDHRPPFAGAVRGVLGMVPVQEGAAYNVIWETDPGEIHAVQPLALLGPAGAAPVLARARAAAQGKPPGEWPPLPDAASVTPERRATLVSDFEALEAGRAAAWFAALTPGEQLALLGELQPGQLSRVAEPAMRVARVAGPILADHPTGGAVDTALLKALSDVAAKELAAGNPVFVAAVRSAPFEPMTIAGWSGNVARIPLSSLAPDQPGTLRLLAQARNFQQFGLGELDERLAEEWLRAAALGGVSSFCFFGTPADPGSDTPEPE